MGHFIKHVAVAAKECPKDTF